MPELSIRLLTEDDRADVIDFWKQFLSNSSWWNEPDFVIRRKQSMQDGLFFVGEVDGTIIATVMAGYDGIRGWIYSMAVAKPLRRNGIGRSMMEHAENALLALGCAKINLQVRATNNAVIGFYESLGFRSDETHGMGKPLESNRPDSNETRSPERTQDAVDISRAEADDLPEIVPLFNAYRQFYGEASDVAAVEAFLTDRLNRNESVIFLARRKSQAIGFTQLYPSFTSTGLRRVWILNDLFVTETARRTGVGSALLDRAVDFARETDAARLALVTEVHNYAAQRLYRYSGWKLDREYQHFQFLL